MFSICDNVVHRHQKMSVKLKDKDVFEHVFKTRSHRHHLLKNDCQSCLRVLETCSKTSQEKFTKSAYSFLCSIIFINFQCKLQKIIAHL
ncbi:CLUMA_CG012759, isoform A [Clunio marinus]|uniref:CLUMA_CG012759, isoform A n=1 Tax=Clunio marinus TaxID=568069 RepID=A0A1J1IGM2_9DIPT|nr:CLUMA_CG012759, isoform A [Clunio marinus]